MQLSFFWTGMTDNLLFCILNDDIRTALTDLSLKGLGPILLFLLPGNDLMNYDG